MNKNTLTVLGYWAVHTVGETTSFLLETESTSIVIDTCPGLSRQLHALSKKFTDIDAFVLSHLHGDHILGFPYGMFMRDVQARGGSVKDLSVLGNRETLDGAHKLLSIIYPDREFNYSPVAMPEGFAFDIGDVKILSTSVDHTIPTSAFRFEGPGFSIGYTSDSIYLQKLESFFQGVDLLIGECFGSEDDFGAIAVKQKHMTAEDIGKLAERCCARTLLPFHMHAPYVAPEKMKELEERIRVHFSGIIVTPSEFLTIEV